jgi:predicted esterase
MNIVAPLSAILITTAALSLASERVAIPPRDIGFKATIDGSEQHYVELLPPSFDNTKSHDLVLAFHGHGSDRWQFINDPRGECKGVRDMALKYGMILVAPDYRAKTSWMGSAAEADVVQIIAELKTHHSISRVFLAGGSMGGTAVLTFAVLHPDLVAGVCSLNGTANLVEYENFQDARTTSFGGSKTDKPEEYKKRSAEFWPEKFTMPVAFTTSGKDTTVPPQSVLRLVEKLKLAKRKVLSIHREKNGHSTSYEDTCSAMEFMLREAGCIDSVDQTFLTTAPPMLDAQLAGLKTTNTDLRADAAIFSKGIHWALRYETSLAANDVTAIKKALERGTQRVTSLEANAFPWITKKGKVLRGFVSVVDGSTQP